MRYFMIACASLGAMLAVPAHAGALDVSAPASVQTFAALSPSAQKVYPPLPTLAMLPAAGSDEADTPAKTSSSASSKKGKKGRRVVEAKNPQPDPRLVVSDNSRTYMKDVERQLDAAFTR
jgi:hypothetical protein